MQFFIPGNDPGCSQYLLPVWPVHLGIVIGNVLTAQWQIINGYGQYILVNQLFNHPQVQCRVSGIVGTTKDNECLLVIRQILQYLLTTHYQFIFECDLQFVCFPDRADHLL